MDGVNRGAATPKGYNWLEANADYASDECLIWPFSLSTPGYGQFEYQGVTHRAHRFVCEQTHGPVPSDQHQAAHSCGNRACCNPRHLSWKTRSENQLDRRVHGTEFNGKKLTEKQVVHIRRMKGIISVADTAEIFGVTPSNVQAIQHGKTWQHVEMPRDALPAIG